MLENVRNITLKNTQIIYYKIEEYWKNYKHFVFTARTVFGRIKKR